MSKRNRRRNIATNSQQMLSKMYLTKKESSRLVQYTTPVFKRPSQEDLEKISFETYNRIGPQAIGFGDLPDRFYGSSEYWYIIARFQ